MAQRQLQLFTVLEKYHLLPDNLENLQSRFGFLKQASSKNVKHLQQAITVQQTYTANLCTYINNILPHITKLEETILQLEQKITTEQDTIQIIALDNDPDIDGPNPPRTHNNTVVVSVQEHLTSSEPEVSNAANFQEEDTKTYLMPHTTILRSPMGMTIPPGHSRSYTRAEPNHFRIQHRSRRNP